VLAQVPSLSQQTRLVIVLIYAAGLLSISALATGSLLPRSLDDGLWLYSGLAALLLGNLLVTPYFTKPVDTVSYSVAALAALLPAAAALPGATLYDRATYWLGVAYVGLVLIASMSAMALKDSVTGRNLARWVYAFASRAGTPTLVFSAVFLVAVFLFHRGDAREVFWVLTGWLIIVVWRPLEGAILWFRSLSVTSRLRLVSDIGRVVSHQTPGLVIYELKQPAQGVQFGQLLAVREDDGNWGLVMALDQVGYVDGPWHRGLRLPRTSEAGQLLAEAGLGKTPVADTVLHFGVPESLHLGEIWVWKRRQALVGVVAPDTTAGHLKFEIVRSDLDLAQGSLVETIVDGAIVLYQVLDGLTKEEILQKRATHGYVVGSARKIGRWNATTQAFEEVPWLPSPNAPVVLSSPGEREVQAGALGFFPGTGYPVTVEPSLLVTHNTAILGILGAGKTFLALELVERIMQSGIKVVCLDLTNQYAENLEPFCDSQMEAEISELQAVGPPGKTRCKQNVEEGGSIAEFSNRVKAVLRDFLDPGNDSVRLKVFNPSQFEVWRQDSRPYQGVASMASLTPAEITRVFAEAALEVVQEHGMSDTARCCLVFEEAHSLIPEWTAAANDGDRTAANGTARAILQGRKYGMGCIVVTQRTASVSKSVLNQCNTVFALRVFDATGMEFLKNYIGDDYASVLSSLPDRHAVLFGRASSCHNPVLIRLNDREDFIRVFRGASS